MSRRTSTIESHDLPHPIVARMWERMSRACDAKGAAQHRTELVDGLHGRVIEVGAGNGANFAHYPTTVREVLALEPEPHLRASAERAAVEAPVRVTVVGGTAEALPGDDAAFDAAVVSLVLCTVTDVERALHELKRVLRAGGELRFYEHVLAHRPGFARMQRAFDLVYPRINGWGCRAARDTPAEIEAAGFEIQRIRRFPFRASILDFPLSPHVLGVARRPGLDEGWSDG
jgi:ubiquinone/menaquinone biosynthesis C-methylase UbiE